MFFKVSRITKNIYRLLKVFFNIIFFRKNVIFRVKEKINLKDFRPF